MIFVPLSIIMGPYLSYWLQSYVILVRNFNKHPEHESLKI